METTTLRATQRPRAFVAVTGPDAATYLNRMVSNDVEALEHGAACDALLLTPKARIIAPLVVFRRGEGDFLLLTEPELGEAVRAHLLRTRFAAKCAIELEEHRSTLVVGEAAPRGAIPNGDYGLPAYELVDAEIDAAPADPDDLERLRILARTPRFGRELDERVLPAEAGLEERAVSFTKGCYPGQEPVARLHYRGHPNRGLRVLHIEGDALPPRDAELTLDGKPIGRVTSAVGDGQGNVLALAYVRREVAADAELLLPGGRVARGAR